VFVNICCKIFANKLVTVDLTYTVKTKVSVVHMKDVTAICITDIIKSFICFNTQRGITVLCGVSGAQCLTPHPQMLVITHRVQNMVHAVSNLCLTWT